VSEAAEIPRGAVREDAVRYSMNPVSWVMSVGLGSFVTILLGP
jgi:hypothetical protein